MLVPDLIVISCAGRALAASALRADKSVHIIDCFADTDTARYAQSVQQVRYTNLGFDYATLRQNLVSLLDQCDQPILVPCSGFEYRPKTLTMLASLAPCLGNVSETVHACKDPYYFFSLLKRLSIPYPDTKTISIPKKTHTKWLVKTIGAMGGAHIRYHKGHGYDPSNHYLQRYIPGVSMSAVFIADGKRHRILGLSEHLSSADGAKFTFDGAISVIDRNIHYYITHYLERLVPALRLIGLCGVDFIADDANNIFILEINPRPPATFELHEQDHSFFDWHLQACQGRLPATHLQQRQQHNVMFNICAPIDLSISSSIRWPDWCRNRPAAGVMIKRGSPVCTIYTTAVDKKKALDLLAKRQKKVLNLLQQ